ncbi:hypothetical protein OSB04_030712 [Centaurea solstitialis]|uniref:Protein kinase domain-containing protein n=1 Tax=Centaurea solstitialis TaxID=347529 RepID=A0AA38W5A0_9ASTR|nr:hypothetical protein OSB04_030712 [Centaurea solstitialis]
MTFMDEFRHLKIQLEEIKIATDNFGDNNLIGTGGFGKVYKGVISHSKGRCMVAFKRLDSNHGQGNIEFWREIMMLSRYTHENLVTLLGFCDEDGEKILVYEHACRGSLDRHLSATTLTWLQRLRICLGAARGINYLHDPKETQQRVLHRDIKSSNILLDENWNAKVSDMGLSKIGPANQQHTILITNAVGTLGYLDPLYMEIGLLTKESDVYSFGVLLFEVLCGRLCYKYSNDCPQILVRTWKQSYKQKKLDEIIFQDLKLPVDSSSLRTFSNIAYQCLERSREKRPPMVHVVEKLELALKLQEIYEAVIGASVPPLIYKSKEELKLVLSKGILVNRGKTWFSLDKHGEHCVMISAADCITDASTDPRNRYVYEYNSRFAVHNYLSYDGKFKTHVQTQLLSPEVTYTVNLVFKCNFTNGSLSKATQLALKYKLRSETGYTISYLADGREDGWLMVELYHFTNDKIDVDLEIWFESSVNGQPCSLLVEGIEFRPLDDLENEAIENIVTVDMLPLSDSNLDWEQKLPNDYEEIINWSKCCLEWTTKKQLYSLLCKGFLIINSEEWFFIAKNGKKCHMLSARAALQNERWAWRSLPKSRFGEVAFDPFPEFSISSTIKPQLLSPQTTYAGYLVYKLPKNHSRFKACGKVINKDFPSRFWYIFLVCPQTPVLRPKVDQNTHSPFSRPKKKGLPQLRNDGWMEVQIWEFQTYTSREMFPDHVELMISFSNSIYGFILSCTKMMNFKDEFQHLKIQPEEIKLATDNFGDNNQIGTGGFGKVYKGVISHSKGQSMAAIKRLDGRYGQGNTEFWREIMMLSRYTHENLVSLLGFCDEDGEKILVYEYASHGSLDRHLSVTALTWMQRLRICLAATRGLSYLHDPKGTQQRVLHRDVKSSNILLDENWNAKVSDFGLSRIGPANQQHTAIVSNVVGTLGYLDPLYMEMGWLTKESDVYSLGVVLFEVLCGRLCFEYNNGRVEVLTRIWKQSYKQNKLHEVIHQDLSQQMDSDSLETFSDIAYQCLRRSCEKRPTMALVMEKLEIALKLQEAYEEAKQPTDYKEIIQIVVPDLDVYWFRPVLEFSREFWKPQKRARKKTESSFAARRWLLAARACCWIIKRVPI